MNIETRHALDKLAANVVELTNHIEAGIKKYRVCLSTSRSDEDSVTHLTHDPRKWWKVKISGG